MALSTGEVMIDPAKSIEAIVASAVDPNSDKRAKVFRRLGLTGLNFNDEPIPECNVLATVMAQVTGAPMAIFNVIDPSGQQNFAGVHDPHGLVSGRHADWCVGVCGDVLGNGPIVVGDLTADPHYADNPFVTQAGFRAYAGVQLFFDDEPFGTACIAAPTKQAWDQRILAQLPPFSYGAVSLMRLRADR